MADWLLNAAKSLQVKTVTLDILNAGIDPGEMEKLPLRDHLPDLKIIIQKELKQNGFDENFIVEAKIKVTIPDINIYAKTLYCYPKLMDQDGREYTAGRIIETASEEFDPFLWNTISKSFWARLKKVFK